MKTAVKEICRQFTPATNIQINAMGNGLINDTFLIQADNTRFVLQRINSTVFPHPNQIMDNLIQLSHHLRQKNSQTLKLKLPQLLSTLSQQSYFVDTNHDYWRALEFIESGISKEFLGNQQEAEQVGFALAHFHFLSSDVNIDVFHDTLPGFHITPLYFKQYKALENRHINNEKQLFCQQFINAFQPKIASLEKAKQKGILTERIIHGDPKLNNFLFDIDTDNIISLVDLDTVKPGLIHYDIADCLRSCCHSKTSNEFDVDICTVILNSYLKEARGFLSGHDYHYLYPAIELIPFELGLRFYIDYLQGNQYFKVDYADQNLDRARNQFRLCQSINRQEEKIKRLIAAGYK